MTLSVDSSRLATDLDHPWTGYLCGPDWRNSRTHSTMSRSYQAATAANDAESRDRYA